MLCRSLIMAILARPATAIITPTAQCTCMTNGLPRDASGMIMSDGNNNSKLNGTYGDSCGVQLELFSSSCVGSDGQPKANAEAWCTSTWCWVDPCTCNLPDVARSSYFSADLYYSYSNCGGVDTFTSTNQSMASCTAMNHTSKKECMPRMANDYPLVKCAGGIMGECRQALMSTGAKVNYPASYGEGCGIHAEPGMSDCYDLASGMPKNSSAQAAWCKQPFSWVNPCECMSSDMAASGFFPGLFYSYSVCGGNDTYTTAGLNVSVKAGANCPSPPPALALVQSPGNFPNSDPKDKKCSCMPMSMTEVPLVNCSTDYAQNGKCVNATNFPGFYPANYGATCGIHMEPLSESCFDLKSGRPWKSPCRGDKTAGCRASWCDSAFCFVDPCTCEGVNDIAKSSWFPDANLYYSYETCKGVDTFTGSAQASNTSTFKKEDVCTTGCRDVEKAYEDQGCCTAPEKNFVMPKSGSMLKATMSMPKASARRLSLQDLTENVKAALDQAATQGGPDEVRSFAKVLIDSMEDYIHA